MTEKDCIKWVNEMADEFLREHIQTASIRAFISWIEEKGEEEEEC